MTLIENSAHCVIKYDPDIKCIIQTWKGFSGSKKFRISILNTIEAFKEYNIEAIISNTQDCEVVNRTDTDWTVSYANPILIEHGLRKMAFIVPKNVLTQWSVGNFMKGTAKQQLPIQCFDNLVEAKAWMLGLQGFLCPEFVNYIFNELRVQEGKEGEPAVNARKLLRKIEVLQKQLAEIVGLSEPS